ncbi:HNH endonuclease [Priestia megaterium]|uniref:HNH endonuclease n=1 Tax=Priestia megaterium TaxID=1404 RepID=UPI0021C1EC91|nr:HNH endonuclease [Priestia megaterium]MCT9858218.1 HNH endonuclease [Priestia megaterium]MDF1958484.1 HNH endonuclease [Priestia megaterium]
MEQWKILKKPDVTFKVSNEGRIQVFDERKQEFKMVEIYSYTGGHEDNRYLSTHGHYVHRLVAEAWIGSVDGMEVNHKNPRKLYNYASNLEIVTPQENQQHSWKEGLRDHQKLSEHERHQREQRKDMKRMNRQWLVLDLDFNTLSKHDSQEDAAVSIKVSRQTANKAFRLGTPIKKQYYICRLAQVETLKERIFSKSS